MMGIPKKMCKCGAIHPGPPWNDQCPAVLAKEKNAEGVGRFISELSVFLFNHPEPNKVINDIRMVINRNKVK